MMELRRESRRSAARTALARGGSSGRLTLRVIIPRERADERRARGGASVEASTTKIVCVPALVVRRRRFHDRLRLSAL